MVTKVEFTNKTENPFYGMLDTLQLYQQGSKGIGVTEQVLSTAWKECVTTERKALFFSLLFSFGDITARNHYIFETKVDSGGSSLREQFRDVCIPFMTGHLPDEKMQEFMILVMEYTTMDNILAMRVKTRKKTEDVIQSINMVKVFGFGNVVQFCTDVAIKGTEFQKLCLAKFLGRPKISKRKHSKELHILRAELIQAISDQVGWVTTAHEHNVSYDGYYEWRKQYTENLESYLFASKAILNFSKEQFLSVLQSFPAGARFRAKKRILGQEQWAKLKPWYEEWEASKDSAQTEQRELEELVKTGVATKADKARLHEVRKEAKVTTGAINWTELFTEILTGKVDKVKVQPFLDKVTLDYNTLVIVDDSGSMNASWNYNPYNFNPRVFSAFMAAICLTKNPDPEARNLLGMFSDTFRMVAQVDKELERPNSLMRGKIKAIPQGSLINPNSHFIDNFLQTKRFIDANSQSRGTDISCIAKGVVEWVKLDPIHQDWIMKYPVWTIISDGEFNNLKNPTASMNDFMKTCENGLGFKPFLIIIDVAGHTSTNITNFAGLDNVIMVPPNPNNIQQILCNFKDIDMYDVYTPLQSMYRSNRYEPVRKLILQ